MNEKMFENIFEKLQAVLPVNWKKIVFYARYTEGSYSMKFYTKGDKGEFVDCFSQKGMNRAHLLQAFMGIDKILTPIRATLDDKNRWSVMTLIIEADGNVKSFYDYVDISENSIAYEREWKKKYL